MILGRKEIFQNKEYLSVLKVDLLIARPMLHIMGAICIMT